jgi:3-oxoacyl-(acyl-carrier-protein) synthase
LEAIAFGGDLLRNRTCDCVIAGGCDALDRPLEKAMQLMRCSASGSEGVPYQSTSNGYVPGEGAGFVILERRETAVARNARIYGRIRGFASAGSRVRLGSVDGEGKAARQALREAVGTLPLRGRDVAVFGAANGTRLLDHAELAVVKSVALDGGWRPKLVSLHGTLGETLGAGSVLSTIAGLMTLREGKVPSWRGETSTSPDASFAVGNSKWSTPWLIVNAAGFGGAASSLVVEVAPEIDNVG